MHRIGCLNILFDQIFGSISLDHIIVNSVRYSGNLNNDTTLTMNSVKYGELLINDLMNNGRIRFFTLMQASLQGKKALFKMSHSNIGKMEIFNLEFESNSTVIIRNCFLIDAIFVDVKWPTYLQVDESIEKYDKYFQLKEIYRQLKYSYSKQGDSVLEHRFHGLEMDAYREYLKLKRKKEITKCGYSRWRIDRQTSIILWFSAWSSEYGQSFKRPIYMLFGAGLLLFPVMVTCGFIKALAPGFQFNFNWESMSSSMGHFLNFINPLRRYDTMEINVGLLLDFLMRIIASYCIYNFIRATRRFVK